MSLKSKDKKRSFGRSLRDCLNGISYVTTSEKNFIREIIIAVLTLILSMVLKIEKMEFIFVITTIFLVLITEIINTAIEKTVDLCTTSYNEVARIAKDVSAGAVLTSCFLAVIIGIIIFGPKIIDIIGGI